MTISFTNYVNITSGVAGQGAVRARELITRIFTANPLVPANSFAEFTTAAQVATYFGSGSTEYAMAAYYFGFVSKSIITPQKISFASWVQTALAPSVVGDPLNTGTLAHFNSLTSASFTLTLGVTTQALTGLNFSSAANFGAVATILQTAINAVTADPQWHTATVNFVNGSFTLVGGVAGPGAMGGLTAGSFTQGGTATYGWNSPAAIISQGSAVQSLTNTMIASVAASSNFGSFAFIPTLTPTQILELSTWLSTTNFLYMYLAPVSVSNAATVSASLISLPGVAMTLSPLPGVEFPELIPGMIMAATDYTKPNASQNYMFQQPGVVTPSVTSDVGQATYDPLRVNYYGSTQTAGQIISFYQRGVLTGGPTAATDMNVYANEIWFKNDVGNNLMSLLLALNQISANAVGRSQLISTIQSSINDALFNSVISVASAPFTSSQILSITQISNDPNAWRQVQTIGYWFNVSFSSYVTVDGRTEYEANYTLIYAKNNAIRKIVGTHVLI